MTTYSQLEISRWAYDGENEIRFVLADDAKMLQQHNEEMLEVLKLIQETDDNTGFINSAGTFSNTYSSSAIREKLQSIIAKAEEV